MRLPLVVAGGAVSPRSLDGVALNRRGSHGRAQAQWHVRPDGSHLVEKWNKFLGWASDPALAQRVLVDLLRAGETSEQEARHGFPEPGQQKDPTSGRV